MTDRYFDEDLRAWVTVLPAGRAHGAHTVDTLRPMKASGWRAGKSAAAAKLSPSAKGTMTRVRPATDADLPAASAPAPPFYSRPLQRLAETIEPMTLFARTLPPDALAAELDQLRALAAEDKGRLAERFMASIYLMEQQRRSNPELAFDDELDVTLSRLERQTNAVDRRRVHEIGMHLRNVGGVDALRRAHQRMLAATEWGRRHIRAKVLDNRWKSLGGGFGWQ